MKSISKLFKYALKISNDEEFGKVPFTAQEIGQLVTIMIIGHHSMVLDASRTTDIEKEAIANFCANHNLTYKFIKGEYCSLYDEIVISW